jgi:hypothetical protein
MLNDLKEARFISLMINSNHLNFKLVPLLITYYHPARGVIVKALELVSLGREKDGTEYVREGTTVSHTLQPLSISCAVLISHLIS